MLITNRPDKMRKHLSSAWERFWNNSGASGNDNVSKEIIGEIKKTMLKESINK